MKKIDKPKRGTPEYDEWLKQEGEKYWNKIIEGGTADFDEVGVLAGDMANLDKTDAELFTDELEEYTPEERRKLIKEIKKDD